MFAVLASRRALLGLRDELAGLIDPNRDNVRFYRIASHRPIYHRGRPLLPGDLLPAHPMLEQLRLALG